MSHQFGLNNFSEVIKLLAKICENKKLKVLVGKSTKAAIISGAGAFLGGLLLGRTGILLGGAMGTGIAALTSDNFMPLAQVLKNLDDEQKKDLSELLCITLKVSIPALISILSSNPNATLIQLAFKEVESFLLKEKNLKVIHY